MILLRGRYLKCSHKICRVSYFIRSHSCEVVDVVAFVLRVREQFLKFSDILPGFAEVEWSKILVEAVV
jgi:hypothetical protein